MQEVEGAQDNIKINAIFSFNDRYIFLGSPENIF